MNEIKIGVIGGGQLARMLALSGMRLGFKFSFLVESDRASETDCIEGLGNIVVMEDGDTATNIYIRMGSPDVITVEKEQVDLDLLKVLESFCPVYPNPEALTQCSHRYKEKNCWIRSPFRQQAITMFPMQLNPWNCLNQLFLFMQNPLV